MIPSSEIANLLIDDGEYDNSKAYSDAAADAQRIWENFIKTSRTMLEDDKALVGKRADNYLLFIQMLDAAVGSKLTEMAEGCTEDMKQYLSDIDAADQAMY